MLENETNVIDKMFEYNLWANMQLIELCGRLDGEQLEVEVTGVFGRIHPTLVHLVRAEGGYINRLTGTRPWAEDLDWDAMPMSELLEKAQVSGKQLIAISSKAQPETKHVIDFQGQQFSFFNWTVVLQALYHGIEHRTQTKVLLTKLGVEHPELAAWDYTEAISG